MCVLKSPCSEADYQSYKDEGAQSPRVRLLNERKKINFCLNVLSDTKSLKVRFALASKISHESV